MLRKVPAITALFWTIKILTTAQGEAFSDYLVHTINPYYAVALGLLGFVVALAIQLRLARYHPGAYWFAVLMVAVFGTMGADAAHIELKIPYAGTAAICALGLAVVFSLWYATERTLSIHSIETRRRELFYWAAVLATFAMGTAVGDLTAYTLQLGFFKAGLLFTVVYALPFLANLLLRRADVFFFWFAYVITRPLGASYADWLGVPKYLGGLDLGRGTVSVALTVAFAVLVGYLWITEERPASRPQPAIEAG